MIADLEPKRLQISPFWIWIGFLSIFLITGGTAGVLVLWKGLSLTNLSDLVPWGLWITIDLSSIAMAGGAFFMCAGVYLVGLKEYQPIARTATFIGISGYAMAMLALFLDIGQPFRFPNALMYWNTHSLLWEVTMCVMFYFTVLVLEVIPIIASFDWLKNRYPNLTHKMESLHRFAPTLAVIGMCLSMLHQSSLGAVYGVMKARPIWYRPDIAIQFILSAVIGGMSLTVFTSMLAVRLTNRANANDRLLERTANFIGWALCAYLYLRFWDTLAMTYTYQPGRTEALAIITSGQLSFNFWFGEILLGAVIPAILLLKKSTRAKPVIRMIALLMVVGGVVALRWDTNIAGLLVQVSYLPGALGVEYTSYTPSLIEWATGLGIIAVGFTVFSFGVRYLHVVDHKLAAHHEHEPETQKELPYPHTVSA
jgi:molybdopterin-containing oxidoreductase family membrane subunit